MKWTYLLAVVIACMFLDVSGNGFGEREKVEASRAGPSSASFDWSGGQNWDALGNAGKVSQVNVETIAREVVNDVYERYDFKNVHGGIQNGPDILPEKFISADGNSFLPGDIRGGVEKYERDVSHARRNCSQNELQV